MPYSSGICHYGISTCHGETTVTRRFSHDSHIRSDFPNLTAIALTARLQPGASVRNDVIDGLVNRATTQLERGNESEFPEIQAWRRAFSQMGLKPTQYRCAAESLLRRLRIDGSLPSILPIIDLCNAISVGYALPVAVFDTTRIHGNLTVQYADGSERFETFSGEAEQPGIGEVIFADDADNAHARRWTHRQAGSSAARRESTELLIVSEAMHDGAESTVAALGEELARLLTPMAQTVNDPVLLDASGIEF